MVLLLGVHPADISLLEISTATSMASIPVLALSPLDSVVLVLVELVRAGVSVLETVGSGVEDTEANRGGIGNLNNNNAKQGLMHS